MDQITQNILSSNPELKKIHDKIDKIENWDKLPSQPLVTICMSTFNHDKFIEQALDGVLMQQVDFDYEIIIKEDCSTDNTRKILLEYQNLHPDKIRLWLCKENLYRQKQSPKVRLFARGKYSASCEGDDYWTDPLKLQKQANFLIVNNDYSFCFHDTDILMNENNTKRKRIGGRKIDEIVDLKSLIIENNIPTASLLYRNSALPFAYPEWLLKTTKGDYALTILLAEKGLGKYLPEVMSVYRLHEGGVWSSKSNEYTINENIKFYNLLSDYFKDSEILRVVKQKRNKEIQNKALSDIRKGQIFKGLYDFLSHLNFINDKRLKTRPRNFLSALKQGIMYNFK